MAAKLYGLILCGGYSTRMQEDKSNINYHGIPQWKYLVNLLQTYIPEVYISCREDQKPIFSEHPLLITDIVEAKGPSAGILSAHQLIPDAAWFVIACDLPMLGSHSINFLIDNRDSGKAATAFISPFNHLAEPLITIWEPAAIKSLAHNVATGVNCPRKTLLNTEIKLLENPYSEEQFNANTPEDKTTALKQL